MFDPTALALALLLAASHPPAPSPGMLPAGRAATFTLPGRAWGRWPYRPTRYWIPRAASVFASPGDGLCDDPDCASCRIEVYP